MNEINQLFTGRFGDDTNAFTVRAPGRVNLIGEHVDYNDGFVLPMAISLQTTLRIRPRQDKLVRLFAADLNDHREFSLDAIAKQNSWIDYVQGVADEMKKLGVALRGFEGIVTSSVPMASGLSSSAALEVGAALAFSQSCDYAMTPVQIATLCQRAENKFVGVNSGIMDQMAVAACIKDNALLIDCRSLELENVPLQLSEYSIIVTDSGAPRELASSAYNERRAQCEEGLAILQRSLPDAQSLRDISTEDLARHGHELSPLILRRVQHVVDEIARTQAAVAELKNGNLPSLGAHMNDSHQSLAQLYEVSSSELDWLTDWARAQNGVLGSRMTGAGFGGCTVTLIATNEVADFMQRQPIEYRVAMNRDARCWECKAEQGAEILD